MAHKIFTAEAGRVTEGAAVYPKIVADYTINVIEVGESGRGRRVDSVLAEFADGSPARPEGDILAAANVTQTRSGKTKLVAIKADESEETDDSKAIVVLRSPIGFRGAITIQETAHPTIPRKIPHFWIFLGKSWRMARLPRELRGQWEAAASTSSSWSAASGFGCPCQGGSTIGPMCTIIVSMAQSSSH